MNHVSALVLGLGLTWAVLACAGASDPPYPSDEALMTRFDTAREALDRLATEPDNPELLSALGVRFVSDRSWDVDTTLAFQVWYQDLFGPGGCEKGFAYLTSPPDSLVESIGPEWDHCPPEDVELFRQLDGNWYLYYRAVN